MRWSDAMDWDAELQRREEVMIRLDDSLDDEAVEDRMVQIDRGLEPTWGEVAIEAALFCAWVAVCFVVGGAGAVIFRLF